MVAHLQRRQERTSPPPQATWTLSSPTTRHRQHGSAAAASCFPTCLRNAYCVSPTGRPLVYMDSDHHLPSHTAGTEDGIPRQAGMLPRRKHAAFALRAADWNDSTSACETLLATMITWLEMHRGTIRAARRNIPCGSRDSSTGMWTDGMEHAESTAAAACNAHTASPGGSLPRAEVVRKREDRNHALRGGFSMLLEVRAKQLGALSSPGL
ncbi:hypothetical protein TcYC6_0057160 [Trypanosoma cruzi]|nr:hypothetical protein TcYC6_0057160 [Trypanosoma cruzi]